MSSTSSGLSGLHGERIAFVAGLRTPFAKQATVFHHLSALDLGSILVQELVSRCDLSAKDIELLVFGQVVQMPEAPNIAREIVLTSGLDVSTDAYSISRACATSFQSIANVAESMLAGHCSVGVAGGADSSSVLPIAISKPLASALVALSKARTLKEKWHIIRPLRLKHLWPVPPAVAEYTTGLSMGDTAEQMAKSHGISRTAQDELAHRSHVLAATAWQEGRIAPQVMPLHIPPYDQFLEQDNTIRFDSDLAGYARLKPAFDKRHGTVTAANSTGLTDGAAAVVMMTESRAKALGHHPLGFLRSYAFTARSVQEDMLMGPSYATPIALARAGLCLADLSLIEMHEAFAAQTLVNLNAFSSTSFAQKELGLAQAIGEVDMNQFNVNGGSLAYGHPFAATGARLITQTLFELKRRGGGFGLATACAAGGIGAAMILEVDA